jgi:hypothetical protein
MAAMSRDPSSNSRVPDLQEHLKLPPQADTAQIQVDLLAALREQEQLQDQLRVMLQELSTRLRARDVGPPGTPINPPDRQIARLEARIRGIEQRTDQMAGQLTGILESRIWRTLVRGGGFLLRFFR